MLASIGLMALFAFAGCQTGSRIGPHEKMVPRFVYEVREASDYEGVVVMPVSKARIQVETKATLSEYDLADVNVAEAEFGKCLHFRLTPAAARDFYRSSALRQGKRLVLLVNGDALGVRKVERPVSDGSIFIFLEMPDAELPELALNMKRTILEARRKLED